MRVLRLEWLEFASGSQAVVASKEIEDLSKLEDVKILLFGSPFGFFGLAKALSRKRLLEICPRGNNKSIIIFHYS